MQVEQRQLQATHFSFIPSSKQPLMQTHFEVLLFMVLKREALQETQATVCRQVEQQYEQARQVEFWMKVMLVSQQCWAQKQVPATELQTLLEEAGQAVQLEEEREQVRQVQEQAPQVECTPSSQQPLGHWHWKEVLLSDLRVELSQEAQRLVQLVTQVRQVAWQVRQRFEETMRIYPVRQSQVEALPRVRLRLGLQVRQVVPLLQVEHSDPQGAQREEELRQQPAAQSQLYLVVLSTRLREESQVRQVAPLEQVRQEERQEEQMVLFQQQQLAGHQQQPVEALIVRGEVQVRQEVGPLQVRHLQLQGAQAALVPSSQYPVRQRHFPPLKLLFSAELQEEQPVTSPLVQVMQVQEHATHKTTPLSQKPARQAQLPVEKTRLLLARQEVQLVAEPWQVRQKQEQVLQVLLLQYFPAAQEQKPVELMTVSCELMQVVQESLLVQMAQLLWQVSQSRVLFQKQVGAQGQLLPVRTRFRAELQVVQVVDAPEQVRQEYRQAEQSQSVVDVAQQPVLQTQLDPLRVRQAAALQEVQVVEAPEHLKQVLWQAQQDSTPGSQYRSGQTQQLETAVNCLWQEALQVSHLAAEVQEAQLQWQRWQLATPISQYWMRQAQVGADWRQGLQVRQLLALLTQVAHWQLQAWH